MSVLAIHGGNPAVTTPQPHFSWPKVTERTEAAVVHQLHKSISIYDNSGIIREFEQEFGNLHNREHSLAVSSGTMGLLSAFYALGIGPGSHVVCPNYTFLATATPLMFLGATPVFCDCESDGNMDPERLEQILKGREIDACVITHMWGLPCRIKEIKALCGLAGIPLVEDCSHAHGATYGGELVGTFGDISVWSLQGQKTITGGEGGIVCTNDRNLFERCVLLGHYNKRCYQDVQSQPFQGLYSLTGTGLKLRAHPLALAIAQEQLALLPGILELRTKFSNRVTSLMESYSFVHCPDQEERTSTWYRFTFRVSDHVSASSLVEALHAEGATEIDHLGSTRPLAPLALFQAPWGVLPWYDPDSYVPPKPEDYPQSESYYRCSIRLPIASSGEDADLMDQYIEALRKVLDFVNSGENLV